MEAFSQMASGVMKCLNFTWDAPSKNQNLKMPFLDTMIWVGTPQRTWGIPEAILPKGTSLPAKTGTLEPIILYQFYRKPIANPTPMNSRSAAPLKDQIQTATNKFLRRMKNTSRELPQDHLEEILQNYACDLRRGGYGNC